MINALSEKPCASDACGCKIASDQTFCSGECERNEKNASDTCACGHSDCVVENVLQRNEQP